MRARGLVVAAIASVALSLPAAPASGAESLTVDTFEDSFDGSCADGDCSLRDAIASVDAGGTVRVPSGFYALSLSGAGGAASGDLDVDRAMRIVGVGETGAFLDASALGDRAVDAAAALTLERVTILGGTTGGRGGVVRLTAATSRMTAVTLIGGSAVDGGAVAVGDGAAVVISRSWISGGAASDRGGALFVRGTATVLRSTLSDGSAHAGGAAFVTEAGLLRILDSSVSSNAADGGGGGLHVRGTATLRSATVARNRAAFGGGIVAASGSAIEIGSSVLEGNEASSRRGPTCSRHLASGGNNVADTGGCGLDGPSDRVGVDPRLGPLRQNGGPTPTHALRTGSPAVGNGGVGCAALDQRGAPRSDCDSGAYELVFCFGMPVTIVGTPGPDDLSGGLNPDVFLGRDGDDVFQGSLGRDRACGGRGDDRLIGGPDDDRLAGNGGDDVLRGEGGDDLLLGGDGADVCRGGAGVDVTRRC